MTFFFIVFIVPQSNMADNSEHLNLDKLHVDLDDSQQYYNNSQPSDSQLNIQSPNTLKNGISTKENVASYFPNNTQQKQTLNQQQQTSLSFSEVALRQQLLQQQVISQGGTGSAQQGTPSIDYLNQLKEVNQSYKNLSGFPLPFVSSNQQAPTGLNNSKSTTLIQNITKKPLQETPIQTLSQSQQNSKYSSLNTGNKIYPQTSPPSSYLDFLSPNNLPQLQPDPQNTNNLISTNTENSAKTQQQNNSKLSGEEKKADQAIKQNATNGRPVSNDSLPDIELISISSVSKKRALPNSDAIATTTSVKKSKPEDKTMNNNSEERDNSLLSRQTPANQIRFKTKAIFISYNTRKDEERLLQRFSNMVLDVDTSTESIPDPDPFSIFFEVACEEGTVTFWTGLKTHGLVLSRIRVWLTKHCKLESYDKTLNVLKALQKMSLSVAQLEKTKIIKLLRLIRRKGDKSTVGSLADKILKKAIDLEGPTSSSSSSRSVTPPISSSLSKNAVKLKPSTAIKTKSVSSTKTLPSKSVVKNVAASSVTKQSNKIKTSRPLAGFTIPKRSSQQPSQNSDSTSNTLSSGSSSTSSSSFFQSLKTKPQTVTSSSIATKTATTKPSATPKSTSQSSNSAPSFSFSNHLNSIRNSSSKKEETRKSPETPSVAKKSKKSVRWKESSELVQVKTYELDAEERESKRSTQDARTMEHNEARNAFNQIRNSEPDKDELLDWYTPKSCNLSIDTLSDLSTRFGGNRVINSKEAVKERERESHTLIAVYFNDSIPDSPQEPDSKALEDPESKTKTIPISPELANDPLVLNLSKSSSQPPIPLAQALQSSFLPKADDINNQPVIPKLDLNSIQSLLAGLQQTISTSTGPSSNQQSPIIPVIPNQSFFPQANTNDVFNKPTAFQHKGNISHMNSNQDNPFNNDRGKHFQNRSLTNKQREMRSRDVREFVRNDRTNFDKWRSPCHYFSKPFSKCDKGDNCFYLHLRKD